MEGDSECHSIIKKKYQVGEYKGKGGFGKVYLAEDIETKEKYAVKIIMEKKFNFLKEIKMLDVVSQPKFRSPYVVNLINWGKELIKIGSKPEEEYPYIIMDYASNGELYDYIFCVGKGFEKKIAKLIFHKILKGLEMIHKAGICHRDLKVDNILIDEKFNPKICDFGLAAKLEGKDGSGLIYGGVGTPKYAAPEMYSKNPYKGAEADIFSLGVVLLIITIGKPGFNFPNKNEYYYQYIYNNDLDNYWKVIRCDEKALDDDFKKLYIKMVSYNQDDRPTIKEILESPYMKEIVTLNEVEYKNLEDAAVKEFEKRGTTFTKKNGVITVKKSENKQDGQNRGVSNEYKFFELDLTPKYAMKTGLNMRHFIKIVGNVNPCVFMNKIANKIKEKYGDKIDIIPSEYKLKFDVFFENMEEKDEEEKEEEENEEGNDAEDSNGLINGIKDEKPVIRVKLFESLNGGYIVRFTKIKGGTIEFHQYLEEIRDIIRKIEYV